MANISYTPMGEISVIGRVGSEPTLRYSMSGNPICNFNLAVEEAFDDEESGEFGTQVNWYRIVVLDPIRAPQVHEKVSMGMTVAVAGRHQINHSVRETDGMEFHQSEIVATRFNLKGNPIVLPEAQPAENEAKALLAEAMAGEPDESKLTVAPVKA